MNASSANLLRIGIPKGSLQEMARYVAQGILGCAITGLDWIQETGAGIIELPINAIVDRSGSTPACRSS